MREAVQRKLQNSEEVRIENELKRDTLKSQLIALEKELLWLSRDIIYKL